MTPLRIQIVFHYYCSAVDFRDGEFKPFIQDLFYLCDDIHLIEPADGDRVYRLSDRGRAYVEAVMAMPLPEKVVTWQMPTAA